MTVNLKVATVKREYLLVPNKPQRTNRDRYLLSRYGITEDDYVKLLNYAGGVCWICRRPPKTKRLAVDHDHKTGHVRGLLCWRCNSVLGKFYDDPARFDSAHVYLFHDRRVMGIIKKDTSFAARGKPKRRRKRRCSRKPRR